ncbi:MAG: RidA family protein, partial [Gammaproteobacteria bacterium]|nr:RidA family protein [Gammaproteobacteria bacterium]
MRHLLPEGWPRPSGYSNGIIADGVQVFVAGMIGWDEKGEFPGAFEAQVGQALRNTIAVLAEADAGPQHIVSMTWYVTDLDAYRSKLKEIGAVWREVMGKNYPAMAVVGVTGLVEADAMVEIESTAVLD